MWKKYYKKTITSQLFKITSLNSLNIILKLGIGILTSKVLAIFVGPAGMGLVGNLRNFMISIESFGTLGFQNGIVKYIAENKKDTTAFSRIISTIFFTGLFVCFIIGLGLYGFAFYWNKIVFGNSLAYSNIFEIMVFVLPFYIGSIYFIAIINGLGKYKQVIYINILGSILGLLVTVFLVYKFSVFGALLTIIITPSLLFLISLAFVKKEISLFTKIRFASFDIQIVKDLSHYTLMVLVSGIVGPIVVLAIRNFIIHNIGITQAGFWEAMSRLSTYYMLFINTLLSIYYYPKLVLATTNIQVKKVVWSYYKNILPLFAIGLFLIYFLRFLIVKTLFTVAFEPVSNLFFWQLIGDFFKALSWILGLLFFAKKMSKAFILTEILSLFIMYFSSIYFIQLYHLEGVVFAHAVTYFLYFITLSIYFRKSLF